jgi:DHA2 family multidrug resistance protein
MALGLGAMELTLDLGQQRDWFEDDLIVFTAAVSVLSIISFVFWELYVDEPIVNLRVFLNRNFAVGCALIASVGVVLYGSTALLPLFLQTLLGYSAMDSGLAVSPRGVGSIISMMIVGRLIGKFDSRYLITFGFIVLSISTWMFTGIDLYITPGNIQLPMIISGFAMGFVFVPLTTMAMATLPNEQIGNASGMYNLMRNTGGSIGIAIMTTLLARNSQVHQSVLMANINEYSNEFRQTFAGIYNGFVGPFGPGPATQMTYATINRLVAQQAAVLAYLDDFRTLAVLCILCIPAGFLFKAVRDAKPVEGAH